MKVTFRWGCICRDGRVCAFHQKLRDIEASGKSLEQALAATADPHDAAIIRMALRERHTEESNR